MRIIAGSLRGRQIEAPPGITTRPMLDRVRQAVFNIIGAAYGDPGSVPPVAVLDIFAGSGALGIEALSRGAAYCCFVEEDSSAGRTLQGNLKTLGLREQTQLVQASALTLKAPPPPQGAYTLVFLDPPYPLSRDSAAASPVGQLLAKLPEQADLDPSVLVVLRHEVEVHYDQQAYGRLKAFDARKYGGMTVTFMELAGD